MSMKTGETPGHRHKYINFAKNGYNCNLLQLLNLIILEKGHKTVGPMHFCLVFSINVFPVLQ